MNKEIKYKNIDLNNLPEGWVSFGDVNFLEYGGYLCKLHNTKEEIKEIPNFITEFDVLHHFPVDNEEGKYLTYITVIDINDSWINKEDVTRFCGEKIPNENSSIEELMRFATNVLSYYGEQDTDYPDTDENNFCTKEDALKWFKGFYDYPVPDSILYSQE